jgi:PAS domain S-box-containing protein
MTEEHQVENKGNLSREQRFLRTALIGVFALMAVLDILLWIWQSPPDHIVVAVLLVPIAFAIYLAHIGKSKVAMWVFTLSVWAAGIFLALYDPQTPQEMDDLVGRYLFPVIFVIPIAFVTMKNKVQRNIIVLGTIIVSVGTASYGYFNDPNGVGTPDPIQVAVINGLITVTSFVLLFFLVRNFTNFITWFNNISLRYKLVGAVLVLFVPALSITGIVTANFAAERLENQQQALLGEASTGLTASTSSWLEENVHFLEAMAEFPGIVSMDGDHQKPVLEAVDANNPHVFLVQTTDTNGINVARNDDAEPKDYSDRAWVQGPLSGEDLTFQSLISRTIGKPALAVSVPIKENSGEIVGVLQMAMEFSKLTDAIGAVEIGETGVSFIVDSGDILIAHTDPSYFDGEELVSFSTHPAVGALRAGESGIIHYFDENNNEKMAYLSELDEFGWGVITTVDEAEIQAPSRTLKANTWRGVGLVVPIAGLLIWFVVGLTVRPITELTEVTGQFAAGNFSARARVQSDDEVGRLSQSFNQMAEEVGQQTAALAERAREMEASQRVTFAASERTTPEDFLDLLVNLIVDQFDVYHSQIYLVDEEHKNAVLSQSTGYAGRVLLQRKHHIPLDQESLVTRCINSGEPVLVGNTQATEGWLANELLPYTQSELVVPLEVDGQIIGALDIQAREANRFTDETVPVFESMTEQVAFLYQNNELLENIEFAQRQQQEFVKQLETASQVAGQLTTILDPTQLLDQAVSMLQSNFNFYHAHIYLVDPTGKKLVVQSGSGHVGVILKERGHNIPVDAEKSFVATAFREKMPVRVMNTTQDPNWLPNALLPDTRSEMAVPLITRGQVIGVLDIQSEEVGRFTEVDEDTMLTLAGQLATSVDTARLFADVERSAERDRIRFEVAEELAGDLSVDEVIDVIMEKASDKNLAVTYSLTKHLPDGDIEINTYRSASLDPEISPAPLGEKFKVSENPVLGFLNSGEIFISNDIATDDRHNPAIRDYLLSQGVVSLLAAPFSAIEGDEWQGMIRVSSREAGYFTEDRASMYEALIELGTQALRSARLREKTEEERQRFEALVTYAPDAILLLNYETYMWEDANRNAEAMFGMSREELLKIGPGDVSPSHQPDGRESGEKAVEMIGNAVAGGDLQFEWVHTDVNGKSFDCEIRLALLPGDDNVLLVNITDITDRKQAQHAIVQGDRLKSEFLANMSHELRTPLNSILGYTDVLLMGLDGDLEDDVRIDLEAIHENSQHLLGLINDILDLAKIEAGRMTFSLGEVNVPMVLEELQRNNAGLVVGKDVELVVDAPEDLPTIVADERRVYQVINNLVSNAVKFTEKGSITMRAFEEGDEMVLQVEDTGLGIDKENLDAIFEEFTQVDTSSTRQHEGTGLGLTITRRLVHMHGGTIAVESEVNKGSTFTVRIPQEAKVDPELLNALTSSANGNNGAGTKAKAK